MINTTVIPDEFKKGLYYGNVMQDIFVPERYSTRIISHVISNYITGGEYYKPPIYLAIQGDPGEGKTTQALASCTQRGIMVKYLSASELSGELEAASKGKMEEVYGQAVKLKQLGFVVCILLDDFHLGNSNISSANGRTVNAELLVSYMMNLVESSYKEHIPIILTGNDYSGTYEALLRDGRADIFNWSPKLDEKIQIVTKLFTQILENREIKKIDDFVKSYENYSVAFFAQLRNDLRRAYVEKIIANYSIINSKTLLDIDAKLKSNLRQTNIASMRDFAEARINARKEGGL